MTWRFLFLEEGDIALVTRESVEVWDATGAPEVFDATRAVQIVACGTSYHAGLVARYFIEKLARIPCTVEIASEYRYRQPVVTDGTLYVTISQSGETLDTLEALRAAKKLGYVATLGICNVPESGLVRESDLVRQLAGIPAQLERILEMDDAIRLLAERFADKHHALFLGRGIQFPVALEGALKLKANMQEVRARGGKLFVFADPDAGIENGPGVTVLEMPSHIEDFQAPIAFTVPLQLLAYHVAVLKGTDVDQPRNLAKSVTVE